MIFDAIVISIILILAVKGFFNGFIKEIAGLIGVIGGLLLASTYYHVVGEYINHNLFTIKNPSAIDLVGFVSVFIGFWIIVIFIGFLFNKILKISALGFIDKLLGFIFSALKFFILLSVVLALLCKIEFLKNNFEKYTKGSVIFPVMIKFGNKIINLKPQEITNNIKNVKISIKQ